MLNSQYDLKKFEPCPEKTNILVSDTNQAVQLQRMAGGLKFRIYRVEGLYYLHTMYYLRSETAKLICVFVFAYAKCWLLAHLSRRLMGELIVYPWSVVRRPQYSNIFFSETAWSIKAKFYVEPPWVGGTIFCSRHLGHMTKMAATPMYGKNPSKIFSRTGWPIFTKLGM